MGNEKQKDTLLYIVPFENSGFTIISGEYSAPPLLGYCSEGEYDVAKMPSGLLYLIEKYKFEINKLKDEKMKPSEKIEKLWQEYLGENQLKSYSINDNLLDWEWGQTGPPAGAGL